MTQCHKLIIFLLFGFPFHGFHECLASTADKVSRKKTGFVFAVIDDNYTGTRSAGEKGRYVGADDFLTVSGLFSYYRQSWKASVTMNVVTSRHFQYRYDLITSLLQRTFLRYPLNLRIGAGFVARGNFGGKGIQNGFHKFKDLPLVYLDYVPGGTAALMTLNSALGTDMVFFQSDHFDVILDGRFPTRLVPVRLRAASMYRHTFRLSLIEFLVGYQTYLNQVKYYSEMVRPGVLAAAGIQLFLFDRSSFYAGFQVFPTRNLENDPTYVKHSHDLLPQLWLGSAWGVKPISIFDFMDY